MRTRTTTRTTRTTRTTTGALVALCSLGLLGLPAGPAHADGAAGTLASDFDGDGYADLAIGAPDEDPFATGAGSVTVLYGGPGGLSAAGAQTWSPLTAGVAGTVDAEDGFGTATAAGDVDGDGYSDLAVSAPFWDDDEVPGQRHRTAGGVLLLYGGPDGLSAARSSWWTARDSTGSAVAEGLFGWSLATGDFDGDGMAELAVGAIRDGGAGSVYVFPGDDVGLRGVGSQRWTASALGVPGAYANTGWALAAGDFDGDARSDLAVGAPDADASRGRVVTLYGTVGGLGAGGRQVLSQTTEASGPEPGNRYGASLAAADLGRSAQADLAVGVPSNDIRHHVDAGSVEIAYGGPSGLALQGRQTVHQDTDGVMEDAERNDAFGAALTAGDVGRSGKADLVIGARGEGVGSLAGAGSVFVLYGAADGVTTSGSTYESQAGALPGVAATGDAFGSALAVGDYGRTGKKDLAVGAPGDGDGQSARAGSVTVLYGSAGQPLPTAAAQLWTLESPGVPGAAQDGDGFGVSLGGRR